MGFVATGLGFAILDHEFATQSSKLFGEEYRRTSNEYKRIKL
jgi:hypothetical protein